MKIITNDVEKECWNILKLYEDYDYVKDKIKIIKPNIKESTLKKIASEINFYVKQSEELYKASDNSIITNPLTLFYSLNNLVKAVYLLKNPTKGLCASHGLEIINDSSKICSLKDLNIKINSKGTFANLNELLNNNIPMNVNIKLNDIISAIPELSSIYYLTYNVESNVYLLLKNSDRRGEYRIQLPNNSYSEIKQKNMELIKDTKVVLTFGENALGSFATIYETMATENFEKVIDYDLNNNRYITFGNKIDGKYIKLEQLNAIYILFFAYSMEVRYRAYEWINIIESKEKAIIQKSIDDLKIKMLMCIISLLTDKKFEFVRNIDDYNEEVDYSKVTDKILDELKRRSITNNRSPLDGLL